MSWLLDKAEQGLMPDFLIRHGIRRLLQDRLRTESRTSVEDRVAAFERFLGECRQGPIALETPAANLQHYEVPTEFFRKTLGPRLKYSSCLFSPDTADLAAAENAMLTLTCERAELAEGQSVLELGCGWGSLSLWMAERYPQTTIHAVSNSRTQKEFIDSQARERGLMNLHVITSDMKDFVPARAYDRIVSVEMFEHMRNYRELLRRIHGWLRPEGKLFVHIFCHRTLAYPFETEGDDNWMGRHFFTGGLMPSFDWLAHFQDDMLLEQQWAVNGQHYARTLEEWLLNLDRQRSDLLKLFPADSVRSLQRWRIFMMACAELFAFNAGNEWFVGHYRMTRR